MSHTSTGDADKAIWCERCEAPTALQFVHMDLAMGIVEKRTMCPSCEWVRDH